MNIYEESMKFHFEKAGKLSINNKCPINNRHDLSLAYTPGVAEPCRQIHANPALVYDLTIKKNSVAVVTDGSAVLGLGNIGPMAALPVMEGKAILFKEYAGIDAYPICLDTQDPEKIIETVRFLAPGFGGINLEDISSPRCFYIEESLQNIGIPVFHDDQHGTAIVVQAALMNAAKLTGKHIGSLRIVINGAGAAGVAIAEMLLRIGYSSKEDAVKEVVMCDSKGIVSKDRLDISGNPSKLKLTKYTNPHNLQGDLSVAMKGADVFIGVSQANLVTGEMIKLMNSKSIVFAMANPVPEIMPDLALNAGAFIVGTGRSDFPNQVNNVLAFPGIFRGAMDIRAKKITRNMKMAAAYALAEAVKDLSPNNVIPSPLDKSIAYKVAQKVQSAYKEE